MTTIILDDQTVQTPLGELLATADRIIEIRNSDGALVATIVLSHDEGVDYDALIAETEKDIEEIRRRRQEPLSKAITTDELLARLNAAGAGQ